MRIIVAGIEGVRQVRVRGIFAYSSIGQRGWLLFLCGRGDTLRVIWFRGVYRLLLFSLFFRFFEFDPFRYSFLKSEGSTSMVLKIYNSVAVFSLIGLPPLFGFIPKILVMCEVGFRLGGFSLGFFWAIVVGIWFYSSILFAWRAETIRNLFSLQMGLPLGQRKNKRGFVLLFLINFWGGLVYFLI